MDDKKKLTDLDTTVESNIENAENEQEQKPEGSGIFTADGKELPKIPGGYDIVGPGGSLGDNDFE
jgi:hypothetical protein